uniref:Uncharacterized protein n=1 Tax=Rhizophora mucronata TaxID=61149 RepID=A0A2P2NXW6_RHIMU
MRAISFLVHLGILNGKFWNILSTKVKGGYLSTRSNIF